LDDRSVVRIIYIFNDYRSTTTAAATTTNTCFDTNERKKIPVDNDQLCTSITPSFLYVCMYTKNHLPPLFLKSVHGSTTVPLVLLVLLGTDMVKSHFQLDVVPHNNNRNLFWIPPIKTSGLSDDVTRHCSSCSSVLMYVNSKASAHPDFPQNRKQEANIFRTAWRYQQLHSIVYIFYRPI
jgi:hypothetical protein